MSEEKVGRGPAARKNAKSQASATQRPGKQGTGLSAGLIAAALIALVAGFMAPMLVQAETPLGEAVPAPPAPIFELLPYERIQESSFRNKLVGEAWLAKLAPEPDGLPPLVQNFNSQGLFSIGHPYGAQSVAFPTDDVVSDGVLAQAGMQFDLGLSIIKYSMPVRNDKESLAEYTARLKSELEQKDATFYSDDDVPIDVEYYRFTQLRYKRFSEAEGQEIAHYLYIGPLGPRRVLVVDMMSLPADYEQAKRLSAKIINSFEAEGPLSGYAFEEFPELAGER